jgi:hypothetical protein
MFRPADEYSQRSREREASAEKLGKQDRLTANVRLALAALIAVMAWWAFYRHAFSSYWLIIPAAGFIGLVLYHNRIRDRRAQVLRAAAFYRNGIARLEDRWAGKGESGARFDDPHHVYAADLDLFGTGSLFELLCAARTRMGEEKLASWLLAPAAPETIRERQASSVDLRPRLDLREDLAVAGESASPGVRPEALLEWAETPNQLKGAWVRASCWVLPLLAITTLTVWGFHWPFFLVLLAEVIVLAALKKHIARVLKDGENAFEGMRLFAELLTRIEREPYEAAPLQALMRGLRSHTLPASRAIARLSTVANLAGARRNQIVAAVGVPLMYPLLVALAAERWRRQHGSVVRTWIECVAEFEALLCLAAYSYEHPDDPLPQIVDAPACFKATQIGHPLIPEDRCVRNDVQVGDGTSVVIVSGSNMSGKSTLLRTIGINTVLAMAGGPVRARRLELTPLQTGASIRINDSLREGSSHFYAEISRLRQLFELANGGRALLFLLDEVLQGTNSHDRRIGAEGIVRGFATRGAIGFISTHDLALTDIGGLAPGAIHNMHFQDELHDGRMTFDFKLRPGIVTKSNGLALMRSIGLDV